MFIHDALKEYILCGQTEIIAGDIRNVIDNLSVQHDPCSAASGFEHQFQVNQNESTVHRNDIFLGLIAY